MNSGAVSCQINNDALWIVLYTQYGASALTRVSQFLSVFYFIFQSAYVYKIGRLRRSFLLYLFTSV